MGMVPKEPHVRANEVRSRVFRVWLCSGGDLARPQRQAEVASSECEAERAFHEHAAEGIWPHLEGREFRTFLNVQRASGRLVGAHSSPGCASLPQNRMSVSGCCLSGSRSSCCRQQSPRLPFNPKVS